MDCSVALAKWNEFLAENEEIKFVWFQFTTYIGTHLVRMLPVSKFTEMIKSNQFLTVPNAVLHLLPHDHVAEGGSLTGSFHFKPDLTSLYRRPGSNHTRAIVLPWWVDKDGFPIAQCARSKLQSLTDQVKQHTGFSILVGFEVELIILRRTVKNGQDHYEATNTNHSWCSMTSSDETLLQLLEEVVQTLREIGIEIEQLHAEIAPGQWEFVLPPETPLKAVDCLIIARQTIKSIVEKYGLHATLHPRPFPDGAGTGSHVHISLNSVDEQELPRTESFFAGILNQFRAIAAFTLPQEASYDRVTPGICSGGSFIAWGWDNRETILRRIRVNRFEVKMMDGLANPYLSLCAMLAAGLDGMLTKDPLTAGDCTQPPSSISACERAALGIHDMMPKSLQESLGALEENAVLRKYLGDTMLSTYLAVKRGELKEMEAVTPVEVRNWLISKF